MKCFLIIIFAFKTLDPYIFDQQTFFFLQIADFTPKLQDCCATDGDLAATAEISASGQPISGGFSALPPH